MSFKNTVHDPLAPLWWTEIGLSDSDWFVVLLTPSSIFIKQLISAASICFEVWGVLNPVAEIFVSDFPEKSVIFQAKNYDDLFLSVVNFTNCLLSLNIHIFTFYTYIPTLLANFLSFLEKRRKNYAFCAK